MPGDPVKKALFDLFNQKRGELATWAEFRVGVEHGIAATVGDAAVAKFGQEGFDKDTYNAMYAQVMRRPGAHGGKRSTIGGNPLKADLIGKADAAEVWQAFAEIIDNLLDNYRHAITKIREVRGEGERADLQVDIRFSELDSNADTNKNGEIQIEENSGGVPPGRRDALVQSGRSNWESVEDSVGVWGNGSKIALLKLGRWNIIQTQPIKGEVAADPPIPVQLQFGDEEDWQVDGGMDDTTPEGKWTYSRNYYHPSNAYWQVSEYDATSGYAFDEPGRTCINIRRIRSSPMEVFCDQERYREMLEKLANCFARKIIEIQGELDQNITINFENPRMVEAELRNVNLGDFIEPNAPGNLETDTTLFAHIPGIPFEIHKLKLQLPGRPPLMMEVRIGFPLSNENDTRGFKIWGNDRLFDQNWTQIPASGRSGTRQWNFGTNVQAGRCRGMIFFTGKPEVIPWQGPVKWGFRDTHPYAELVKNTLKWIVTKYTTASYYNLKNDNLLAYFRRD